MTVDRGAVRALATALPLVVPAHLTPFLTADLAEAAGAKIAVELERKGWHLISDAELSQLLDKARLLRMADAEAVRVAAELAHVLQEAQVTRAIADHVLATLRGTP